MSNRKDDVTAAMRGRTVDVLVNVAGIDRDILDGKHHACPKCGGTDRFRLIDADAGAVYCNQCFSEKNGDALAAVQWMRACQFPQALKLVAEYLGFSNHSTANKPAATTDLLIPSKGESDRMKKTSKPKGQAYATADAAIAAMDSTMRRKRGRPVAKYAYVDDAGETVAYVVRYDLADGEKSYRPVSKHGDAWHCCDPSGPWPLYELPELAGDDVVYVCEGEKAADAARSLGLTATTSAHGAQSSSKTNWKPLAGRQCVILPDADESGRKYADSVARILANLTPAAVVKVVELPNVPETGDIVEWIEAGGTQAELSRLVETAVEWKPADELKAGPILKCFADIEAKSVSWLWQNRIPQGRLTVLVGRPGCGKSFLTTDMSARVSTGRAFPDGSVCPLGSVIFIANEDDPHDTIRPRLDAHSANVQNIFMLSGVRCVAKTGKLEESMFTLADVDALELALRQTVDCKLIVIDPIGSYLGGSVDAHRDNEVRSVLDPIAKLAEKYGPAVLIVMHNRKGTAKYADDVALGSRAFTGIARCVWHLFAEGDKCERKLWLPGKTNIAAQCDGMAFSIAGDPAAVVWEPNPVTMIADQWLAMENGNGKPQSPARDEAELWLLHALAERPQLAKELTERAKADGITEGKLNRAKKKLGVVSKADGYQGPWVWFMPGSDIVRQVSPVSPMGTAIMESGETERICTPSESLAL